MSTYKNKTIPSHDIYFRNGLRKLTKESAFDFGNRPFKRISENCFVCSENLIIIRYLTKDELEAVTSRNWQKCFYIVDDDFFGAAEDSGTLPINYRRKLAAFSQSILPEIIKLADAIVAPNQKLFSSYPDKQHYLLPPSYTSICEDFSHFQQPEKIRILFSGTSSHLASLIFLKDVITDIAKKYDNVEFTSYLGDEGRKITLNTKNVQHLEPKPWHEFKKIMQTDRYHIALCPYLDTNFNLHRSTNKFFDHSAFGAAGCYSKNSPQSEIIENAVTGLLVENSADAWHSALEHLINTPNHTAQIAIAGAKKAKALGAPDKVRDFWQLHANSHKSKGWRKAINFLGAQL